MPIHTSLEVAAIYANALGTDVAVIRIYDKIARATRVVEG